MDLLNNVEVRDLGNLDLLAKQVVEGFIIGLHKSPFHGFSVEFAEHRLYNQGESTKNIDWKVYGKTGKLFTKKYEEETNLRCQIIMDTSSSMYFPKEKGKISKLEFSILAAAALMNLLQRQRDAFGLSLFHEDLFIHTKAKSSTTHYRLLLTYLSNCINQPFEQKKSNVTDTIHKIADTIHRRSLVVLFSDMFDTEHNQNELFSALQHLKYSKHEVVLFHVVDKKKEIEFEYENRPHLFIDLETGEKLKLQPQQVKEHYVKQIKKYKNDLKLKCLQYKIDFMEVDINDGYKSVLQSYLVRRNKMKI